MTHSKRLTKAVLVAVLSSLMSADIIPALTLRRSCSESCSSSESGSDEMIPMNAEPAAAPAMDVEVIDLISSDEAEEAKNDGYEEVSSEDSDEPLDEVRKRLLAKNLHSKKNCGGGVGMAAGGSDDVHRSSACYSPRGDEKRRKSSKKKSKSHKKKAKKLQRLLRKHRSGRHWTKGIPQTESSTGSAGLVPLVPQKLFWNPDEIGDLDFEKMREFFDVHTLKEEAENRTWSTSAQYLAAGEHLVAEWKASKKPVYWRFDNAPDGSRGGTLFPAQVIDVVHDRDSENPHDSVFVTLVFPNEQEPEREGVSLRTLWVEAEEAERVNKRVTEEAERVNKEAQEAEEAERVEAERVAEPACGGRGGASAGTRNVDMSAGTRAAQAANAVWSTRQATEKKAADDGASRAAETQEPFLAGISRSILKRKAVERASHSLRRNSPEGGPLEKRRRLDASDSDVHDDDDSDSDSEAGESEVGQSPRQEKSLQDSSISPQNMHRSVQLTDAGRADEEAREEVEGEPWKQRLSSFLRQQVEVPDSVANRMVCAFARRHERDGTAVENAQKRGLLQRARNIKELGRLYEEILNQQISLEEMEELINMDLEELKKRNMTRPEAAAQAQEEAALEARRKEWLVPRETVLSLLKKRREEGERTWREG